MFDTIGWGEILVLIVAGLFILGPERLPSAAAWLGRTIRQVRDYATGAREQIRSELGPEFDDLRKPLQDLREVRNFDPRRAVRKHLFDGENPLEDLNGGGRSPSPGRPPSARSRDHRPLENGERPPFDSDAT
ncbi:sec-independent translocase [Actinopolyspora mortivallis]|uniref:Sec-independent protein translocase protein TatB n=1 Tax=Actinopolyspora mortivallis TaxID=33906 RepID=A0A2T0H0H1_ACTMO|nr:sec-independent translocase [Actinopolyspora mortivallis]PRW64830.1 twin-arginine translocase subunit TatB [Actinopolyspora mortivallis]